MQNLLDFLARHFHWLVFLLLETVSGILLFSYNSYQGSAWLSTANVVTGKTLELQAGVEQFFSLKRLNEELSHRNIVLEQQLAIYREAIDHSPLTIDHSPLTIDHSSAQPIFNVQCSMFNENHVRRIYEPFTVEEINEKIVEMLRPIDMKAPIELVFQSIEGLHKACPNHPGDWYFTGHYPTPGGTRLVNQAFVSWYEDNYQAQPALP